MRAIKYPILCQPVTHELNCLSITVGYGVLLKNIYIKNIKISALSKYIDFRSINYHIFHIRYATSIFTKHREYRLLLKARIFEPNSSFCFF